MAETYQAKFEALVERERRATEQLQRQQEVSAVFLKSGFSLSQKLFYVHVPVVVAVCCEWFNRINHLNWQ